MIFQRFFAPRPSVQAGRALFFSASEQAREPVFYREGGVPDTYEGRFELYTLHVVLLLWRLKGEGAHMADIRQGLFDAFVRNLDDGLREMGVGDLSVGKKMRKLGSGVYGRLKSYGSVLDAGTAHGVAPLLARTVFSGDAGADPLPLARYVIDAASALAAQPTDQLLQGGVTWPSFAG